MVFPLWLTHQKWDKERQISSKGNSRNKKEKPRKTAWFQGFWAF
jgi:hypothetical protein